MKRWLYLLSVLVVLATLATSSTVSAQENNDIIDFYSHIDNLDYNAVRPGSAFTYTLTVYEPSGIGLTFGDADIYSSGFYFVDDKIKFPLDYSDTIPYTPGQTTYNLTSGKVKIGADAPVGQTFMFGVYWRIDLDGNYTIEDNGTDNILHVSINGNAYSASIVSQDTTVSDGESWTYYRIVDESGFDIYVRSDKLRNLYVRYLKYDLEILPALGGGIDLMLIGIIGGVVVVVVVVAVFVALRRGGGAASA